MKLLKSNAMQDDLIRLGSMLGLSIYLVTKAGAGQWEKNMAVTGLWLVIITALLGFWQIWRDKRMTPEEKREAEREKRDERSRMIQDRAMRNCWSLEDAVLIIATIVFVFRNQPSVYSILYLVLVVRELACVATRWWLERKY
ncbi:hypothetical protein D1641_05720 [Colidextribacter sp. OB.20]|uniref:hypothetical protein n=1 Tax=Colidextribacter sp. OB.20 TaxID=2304568 RepID=UPI001371F787|nr:hypothetical protein [Colidextribacter sp. OB.20]NBI09520.1 hypothetical protein [Colidextribacter sp. OB.20]